MKFEEYLKALEIRKDTSKENYDYLYGEFGVGDNYDIALEAPFLEIISYFKNSPRWAYAGATGTLDERVSPDSSGLKGKVKKWEEEISHRIDNERRRIQEEIQSDESYRKDHPEIAEEMKAYFENLWAYSKKI